MGPETTEARDDFVVADAVAPNRSAEPRKRIVTAALSERDLLLAAGEDRGRQRRNRGRIRGRQGACKPGDNNPTKYSIIMFI